MRRGALAFVVEVHEEAAVVAMGGVEDAGVVVAVEARREG